MFDINKITHEEQIECLNIAIGSIDSVITSIEFTQTVPDNTVEVLLTAIYNLEAVYDALKFEDKLKKHPELIPELIG